MSSMTIDQLKKSLTEQGITLPPSRSKKADYIKLYQQYSTINDSLGDVYSSDDENPPKTSSQSITSSTSPGKSENVTKEVELLSDDELYHQLKEFDANIGPVLKNTRRVYEKRLIKILSNNKGTNNYVIKSSTENSGPSMEEFSDSDIEVVSKSPKKNEVKTRKSSVLRDSPKPSSSESLKLDTEKSFSTTYDYDNKSSKPTYSNEAKTSRYSYIETVPKGSSYGFIEQGAEGDLGSDLRQRYTDKYGALKYNTDAFSLNKLNTNKGSGDDLYKGPADTEGYKLGLGTQYGFGVGVDDKYKPGYSIGNQYKPTVGVSTKSKSGGRDHYIGSWEPNVNRYLGSGPQQKVAVKGHNYSAWLKKFLAALLLLAVLLFVVYLCQQWSATDPYKMIQDEAERTIQELSQGSGDGV